MLSLSDRLRRRPEIRAQPFDGTVGGAVLVDMDGGHCWELNRVGAEAWARLDGTATLAEIRDALQARYQVAGQVLQIDLLGLASALLAANLVDRVASPGDAGDGLLSPQLFAERFALATLSDGAVLLDVTTGAYSRLNLTAAAMCSELARADSGEGALAAIAARLGVPAPVARDHLRVLAAEITAGAGPRHDPVGPFRYLAGGAGGYELWHERRAVLRIAGDGRQLALMAPPAELAFPVHEYVRTVAPKLLFLQGVTVLHGSSCLRGDGLLGLCGVSGAGKTTTARLLARHGPSLVSEDLMVVAPARTRIEILLHGESAVHGWAREAAGSLARGSGTEVDAGTLAAAATGPTAPLETIWFLDAGRRGDSLATRPMGPSEAVAHLLANSFLGAADPRSWRQHMASIRDIASTVGGHEVTVPDGLARLEEALGRYSTSSAS